MIRLATKKDLSIILNIYEYARNFMKKSGNETQWNNNFPPEDLLIDDIEKKQLYVYEENHRVHGVFAFIIGKDNTYEYIEDGNWLSNDLYGTIHRVASDGKIKGMLNKVICYCEKQIQHLRIDTHSNNKIMQHLILKNGFIQCGIIYVEDGSSRIAYEKI